MWAEDLRAGDHLVSKAKLGALKGRFEVVKVDDGTVLMRKCITSWMKGQPKPFSYGEVEGNFHKPQLDTTARFGERALILVRTAYDDGRITCVPWVEGTECPFDGGDGVSFEFLGMVDTRATSLGEPDLWAHKEELVAGTYRFLGEYPEPNINARASNPDIGDEEPRRRRGGRSRRSRR